MSVSSVEARKVLLERELARYVDILASQENLEKVIVFGSVAAGEIHEWSDIDLVIIQQTASPFLCQAPRNQATTSTHRRHRYPGLYAGGVRANVPGA